MPVEAHVSLDFHTMPILEFLSFAGVVRIGIHKNGELFSYTKTPKPSVTDEEFGIVISTATEAYNTYKQGGRAQKPAWMVAKANLMAVLDNLVIYVDEIADGDANIIILSGFNVAGGKETHQKQTVPGTPTVTATRADVVGEIDTECEVFGRSAVYNCIVSEAVPLHEGTTITSNSTLIIPPGCTNRIMHILDVHRVKKITGLTPGVYYYFYYYVANTAGVSQLSTGVKLLCG